MKFKSIIEKVPVNDMGNVEKDCYTVWSKSFTHCSPRFTFTDENEALEYVKILLKEKIGNEPVEEVYMTEYKEGYWEACALEHCMYDHGKFNKNFVWELK